MEWILFREVPLKVIAMRGRLLLSTEKARMQKLPTPSAHIFLSNVLKHRSG